MSAYTVLTHGKRKLGISLNSCSSNYCALLDYAYAYLRQWKRKSYEKDNSSIFIFSIKLGLEAERMLYFLSQHSLRWAGVCSQRWLTRRSTCGWDFILSCDFLQEPFLAVFAHSQLQHLTRHELEWYSDFCCAWYYYKRNPSHSEGEQHRETHSFQQALGMYVQR